MRYNRRNTIAKRNWLKLSGIDQTDTTKNKEKLKRAALAGSKTDSNSGVTHDVDFSKQAPVFEGSSGNTIDPAPSSGS